MGRFAPVLGSPVGTVTVVTTWPNDGELLIPDRLKLTAAAVSGGQEWLRSLPDICRRLGRQWGLRLLQPYPDCHVSLVVSAERGLSPAVLKVPMPVELSVGTLLGDVRDGEASALHLWAGDGAVRLLEHDPVSGGMLIEKCMPGTTLDSLGADAADDTAAELLLQLHRATPTTSLPRLSDRARSISETLPQRWGCLEAPFDRWLIETAVELLIQLAQSEVPEAVIHGDFHHHNILAAERRPWLVVDPLPVRGDPAYDLVQYVLFRKATSPIPPPSGVEWSNASAGLLGSMPNGSKRGHSHDSCPTPPLHANEAHQYPS